MSTLWIWTQSTGIKLIPDVHPEDCDGARHHAAPVLGKIGFEDDLCCYSFEVDTGTEVGKQTVYLVWVCEDYELLCDFLNGPEGERYKEQMGGLPPAGGAKYAF